MAEAIRREMGALDAALPIARVRSLDANRTAAISAPRFRTVMLITSVGLVALLLAAIGLYGVVAFTVAQRRREIAIRVALVASPRQVTELFVRRGAGLTPRRRGRPVPRLGRGRGARDVPLRDPRP